MKPKTVAMVGPAKLEDAFTVLLNAVPDMQLLAYRSDFDGLVTSVGEDSPDIVLSFVTAVAKEGWLYCEQAGQIKSLWPRTSFIAFVTDANIREVVRNLGADAIFYEGVAPNRLIQAIEVLDS